MISVGIDAAKDKSTVCIIKQTGEVIKSPYDISHTKKDLVNEFLNFQYFYTSINLIDTSLASKGVH